MTPPHASPARSPAPKRGVKQVSRQSAMVFWLLALLTLPVVLWRLESTAETVALVILVPVFWVGVDLISGLVHWAFDTYGSPETPVVGPVIGDFREHHVQPELILAKDFWDCSANVALAAVPLLVLAHLLAGLMPAGGGLMLGAVTLFLSVSALTNWVHRIAHDPEATAAERRLQRWGLILSTAEHGRHHSGDYRRAYAITNGWSNPLAERLRLYSRAEALIARLGGPEHDRAGPS